MPDLVNKPGTWSNSPVRNVVPDPVRDWLDTAANADRSRLFARIDQATDATYFTTAIAFKPSVIGAG
ncbi:hypothetical protein ACWKWA_00935 [Dermacoccus abyssi]